MLLKKIQTARRKLTIIQHSAVSDEVTIAAWLKCYEDKYTDREPSVSWFYASQNVIKCSLRFTHISTSVIDSLPKVDFDQTQQYIPNY